MAALHRRDACAAKKNFSRSQVELREDLYRQAKLGNHFHSQVKLGNEFKLIIQAKAEKCGTPALGCFFKDMVGSAHPTFSSFQANP
jgi:hypothetical protein